VSIGFIQYWSMPVINLYKLRRIIYFQTYKFLEQLKIISFYYAAVCLTFDFRPLTFWAEYWHTDYFYRVNFGFYAF